MPRPIYNIKMLREDLDAVWKLNQQIDKLTRQRSGILDVLAAHYGYLMVKQEYSNLEASRKDDPANVRGTQFKFRAHGLGDHDPHTDERAQHSNSPSSKPSGSARSKERR